MANTIQLRRSAVQNAVPTTGQLALGELAINTFDGKLYLKKNNGTESVVQIGSAADTATTLATARTINGTSFNGSANITTASWGTARTITIGNTGKSVDGSGNVSWTTAEIGAEYQQTMGVPRWNLGDPTAREAALFDDQFNNKTLLFDITYLYFETSTNNSTWTTLSVTDSQKRKFLTGDTGAGIVIPNGTAYFRIRLRQPNNYVYANALYLYHSTQGHSMQVQAFKKHDSEASWTQITSSTTSGSSWPGHLYLPFPTVAWHYNGTQGSHYHEIYFLFTPTWNASWPSTGIILDKGQIWGGYPAGKRNIYSTDEFGAVTFPQAVNTSSGDITAAGDLVSNFSSGDEGGQIRLSKSVTNTTLTTGVTIDVYQNKLRIFESGGTSRGVYIDLTAASASAGSNLFTQGTVTSVGGTGTVSGLTLTGTVTGSGNLTLGGTLSLTSGNITSGLGYTPAQKSFNNFGTGAANYSLAATDVRNLTNPTTGLGYAGGGRFRFSSLNDDSSTPYADVIDLSTYTDSSGGGFNSLYFGKNSQLIIHKYAAAAGTSWTSKTLAYTDGATLTNLTLTSYSESKVTNATTTGTVTLDLSTSNVFHNTLTGNTTFAFSNPPANTKVFSFTIITVQDATGGRTITWPASKKFAGGVTPPPTTAANAVDVWSVMTYDGGTSYIVSLSVKDAK